MWAIRYGPERLIGRARLAARGGVPVAPLSERLNVPLPPVVPDAGLRPTVLFYAIDGAGLGHLSRCLAIARRLSVPAVFITTCRRADVLDGYGIPYRYVPTFDATVDDPARARAGWQEGLARAVGELLDEHRPAVVVADGVATDAGLSRALRDAPGIARVGIRRAYRLDGRQHLVVEQDRAFHLLLIPHDHGTETVRVPVGPAAAWVGPLMITSREEALEREEARRVLGLPATGFCVLLQLGAGRIGGGKEVEAGLVQQLEARGVTVAVTSYEKSANPQTGAVVPTNHFPLASTMRAFDAAVAAAGYNTFHELMHHGVPTIFVPNAATISDDQTARARLAERAGAALFVAGADPGGLHAAVERVIGDAGVRASLSKNAAALVPRNGAPDAAHLIQDLCRAVLDR
jgi:UDP:flavonoid glycosyltransferase YjiC (YdhE family)